MTTSRRPTPRDELEQLDGLGDMVEQPEAEHDVEAFAELVLEDVASSKR